MRIRLIHRNNRTYIDRMMIFLIDTDKPTYFVFHQRDFKDNQIRIPQDSIHSQKQSLTSPKTIMSNQKPTKTLEQPSHPDDAKNQNEDQDGSTDKSSTLDTANICSICTFFFM